MASSGLSARLKRWQSALAPAASWHWAVPAAGLFLLLRQGFVVRSATFQPEGGFLDRRMFGYTPPQAEALLKDLGPLGRQWYSVSEVLLDVPFAIVYGFLLFVLTYRLFEAHDANGTSPPPDWWRHLPMVPLAAAAADIVENLLIATVAGAFQAGTLQAGSLQIGAAWSWWMTPAVWIALPFTLLKIWLLLLLFLLLVGRCIGLLLHGQGSRYRWEIWGYFWFVLTFVIGSPMMLFAALLFTLVVAYAQSKWVYIVQYLFFLRYPLLAGILLITGPYIATSGAASSLLKNLLVLEGGLQLLTATFLAGLVAMTISSAVRLIYLTAAARYSLPLSRAAHREWHAMDWTGAGAASGEAGQDVGDNTWAENEAVELEDADGETAGAPPPEMGGWASYDWRSERLNVGWKEYVAVAGAKAAKRQFLVWKNRQFWGIGVDSENRSGWEKVGAGLVEGRLFLSSLLAVPFILKVWELSRSDMNRPWLGAVILVAGLAAAWGVAVLARRLAPKARDRIGKVRDSIGKKTPDGIKTHDPALKALREAGVRPIGHGITSLQSPVYFAAFVIGIYALFGLLFHPERGGVWVDLFPAVGYLFLIAIVVTLVASIASLILDKWRAPVVAGALVVLFALFQTFEADHYYEVFPRVEGGGDLPDAQGVMREWHATYTADSTPRFATVVMASGGGIKAALWTARVLMAMDSTAGADFTKSVVLVSSTSGGSLGAMYFQDAYRSSMPPDSARLRMVVDSSAASTLSATVWGIAYPDLLRLMSGGLLQRRSWQTRDRGWALDRRWESRRRAMAGQPDTATARRLRDWADWDQNGWRPAQVFNATIVETGAALRYSTVNLGTDAPPNAPGSAPHEFADLYPNSDVDVATAARMSASFPWVSPMARAWLAELGEGSTATDSVLHDGEAFHVADGGYFDNFGVFSAVQFLEDVGSDFFRDSLQVDRVLLVEIRASGEEEGNPEQGGFQYTTAGPVITMNNVRTSSQIARNDQEIALLRKSWDRGDRGVVLCSAVFVMREPGPLSWQLTSEEADSVLSAWDSEEADQLTALRPYLRASPDEAVAPPPACRVQNGS